MIMNENKSGGGKFWVGFFLGGLIGAFFIFVLGTKEGKKLAKKIEEKAEVFEDELDKKVETLQKHGQDLLKEAQEMKDKVVKEIEVKKHSTSDVLVSKMDQALSSIEDIQKKGVEVTRDLHHHYFRKNGKKLVS